ncbi:MAG: hypothetical protein HY322_11575 [Betaproteobacteria bacterium]|nr:hypothetical protein [Betaproteobacteria bacterium]
MSTAPNPYATPKAVVADLGAAPGVEAVREEHLGHETNIKAVGGLFMLAGMLASFTALSVIVSGAVGAMESMAVLVTGVLLAFLAVSSVVVGWGLRMLRAWARTPSVILAVIGLLGFPIGTLLNAYVLWLLASRKGRMVFSVEYASIVEATPHMKYRTPLVLWILLGVIVLLVVVLFVAALG